RARTNACSSCCAAWVVPGCPTPLCWTATATSAANCLTCSPLTRLFPLCTSPHHEAQQTCTCFGLAPARHCRHCRCPGSVELALAGHYRRTGADTESRRAGRDRNGHKWRRQQRRPCPGDGTVRKRSEEHTSELQ